LLIRLVRLMQAESQLSRNPADLTRAEDNLAEPQMDSDEEKQ
jgi:hypothetical protein